MDTHYIGVSVVGETRVISWGLAHKAMEIWNKILQRKKEKVSLHSRSPDRQSEPRMSGIG